MNAATSVTRTGPVPVRDGAAPEFTTADAEALGIRNLLYTATTFYLCCGDFKNQNRINNIHRIADEVNGAIVMPGEDFSLNDYVGKRTEEDGYRPAGAVVYGVVTCCNHPANMGGGVSQFTTTLYNAIFWAGLGDVEHTPHSIYFTRYPMVREATLGWPEPDLVFRNTTPNAVYLKTEYTDTSITVKVFGDNGGITVESTVSGRYNVVEPSPDQIYWDADPTMTPDDPPRLTSTGTPGFTADATRTITYPDGTTKVQRWVWTYDPVPIRQSVHPCRLYAAHPDYQATCPAKVPDVLNQAAADAQAAIIGAGLAYAEGSPHIVSDPCGCTPGTVYSQDRNPGTWLDRGTVVTVHLWQLSP
jgi:vancomycin resistance protein YoaR